MKPTPHLSPRWRNALIGAALCVGAGVLAGFLPFGRNLALRSYDFLFAVRHDLPAPEEVILVYVDERTYHEADQGPRNFDRKFHAQLLEHLTDAQAKLVVFDIFFGETNRPLSDELLARAIRRHGNVVLAGSFTREAGASTRLPPIPILKTNAAAWGVPLVLQDLALTVRQYEWRTHSAFALPWVAATRIKPALTNADDYVQTDPWLAYYGPPDHLEHLSFFDVTNHPGLFKHRCVFVGSRPATPHARDHADQFRTPYSEWHQRYATGVEIVATAFLNLIRGDALHRSIWMEASLVLTFGALAGLGLSLCRPLAAGGLALLITVLVAGLAIMLAWTQQIWLPWLIPVAIQIPCGLAWTLWIHSRTPQDAEHPIADHTLLRRIGRGAYGEVWLAKNAVGMFQAVKIVERRAFNHADPYEREFRGIEKFMPLSRSHPGFVHIAHVGRNDARGLFHCVMEIADDLNAGQKIDPATYAPRTLASALRQRARWTVPECIELGLALSAALEHLHRHNLVHRDLKPSNILFVHGVPKLADIGLVSETHEQDQPVSYVGTPGFIPPEGPGAPTADVYALGKVLYQAAFGLEAERFPELPTGVGESLDPPHQAQFHELLMHACEPGLSRRYQSAAVLHAELLKLQHELTPCRSKVDPPTPP